MKTTSQPTKVLVLTIFALLKMGLWAQNFTSFVSGNPQDIVAIPSGGVCLMGGASENDNAMKWFLTGANGGDVLVLRTSGSNGYNNYLYSSLGVTVNSVETIVCNNPLASTEPYLLQKIKQAEAIWFAGGDQWEYISFWRNTAVDSLINQAIEERNIMIGGTSAGMAILGEHYFSAQNGTVSSALALANPFTTNVTVDAQPFLKNTRLAKCITDTHFDNPDRKGRLVTFLARIYTDKGEFAKAIACDEYTAVCITPAGIAKVYGDFPSEDDNAYFIQHNCELSDPSPETCSMGNPLTWNLGGSALKVYRIKGDSSGLKSFDLNDWKTGNGGTWLDWSANNGQFSEQSGNPIACSSLALQAVQFAFDFTIFPNPISCFLTVFTAEYSISDFEFSLHTIMGEKIKCTAASVAENEKRFDFTELENGTYFLQISNAGKVIRNEIIIKQEE